MGLLLRGTVLLSFIVFGLISANDSTASKRISELKCRKRELGSCPNARSHHTVVVIDQNQRHISGGTIISQKFVLTKAPCLIDIFTLEVDWDNLWIKQPHVKVIQQIYHPEHDPETQRHDVMLMELESPLTFTSNLLPACLPYCDSGNLYDSTIQNGYTDTFFYESLENRVISNEQCNSIIQQTHHRKYRLHEEEFCTRYRYEGTFFWSRILGGPLQTFSSNSCKFTQVGITKDIIPDYEFEPGAIHVTTVFSRVRDYLDWIEENVWRNEIGLEGSAL